MVVPPPPRPRTVRTLAPSCATAAGFVAAFICCHVVLVYGASAENDLFRSYDFREIFTYQKTFWSEAVRELRLPLWNPHTFSGWPFAANPLVQTFYPPALLYLALPQWLAVELDLAAHLLLAACGTYLLLRSSYSASRSAALFGSACFALGGSFVGHAYAGHIQFWAAASYLPLLLFLLDRASESGSWKRSVSWTAAAGGCLCLQALSGGLPYVFLGMVFALLHRLVRARSAAELARSLLTLSLASAIGFCAAGVQLLPALELARASNRAGASYDYARMGSYDPALLPTLIWPRASIASHPFEWETYGYVGLCALGLAAVGLAHALRCAHARSLGLLGAAVFLFMLGDHGFLFPWLWRRVPGFDLFRAPARAVFLLDLVLALLAGLGAQRLFDAIERKSTRRAAWTVLLLFAAANWMDVTWAARDCRAKLFLEDRALLESSLHAEQERILQQDGDWFRFWFPRALFRENHAFALGALSATGYDNLVLARYSRFIHFMTDTPLDPSLVTILSQSTFANAPSRFPFKILGVRYSGQIELGSANRVTIATERRKSFVRRAWFTVREHIVADEQEALRAMRSDAFDPFGEVVLEREEAQRLPPRTLAVHGIDPEPLSIHVEQRTPENLRIELGPHGPGWLVLSEIHYPGWKARSQGAELPIARVDSILRGVLLSGGEREIELRFEPESLRAGATLSAATLAAMAGWFLLGRIARGRERQRTASAWS